MLENLGIGLEVTGLGMGLVFLTLFICLLVIKGLDLMFKPKPELAEAVAAPGPIAPPAITADEAAAVAVALALQQRKSQPPAPAVKPKETGEEIVGGVMIVKPIEPAPWSGPARKA